MNGARILFSLLLATSLACPLWAQEGPPPEPGPQPPRGMRPGPGRIGPIPAEVEEQVMDFLRNNDPERAQALEREKKGNPEEYHHALMETAQRVMLLRKLQQQDPDGFQSALQELKLDSASRVLVRDYREGQGDKNAIKARLREVLSQLLDVREQNHKHHLEWELAQTKVRMQEMEAKRSSILDRLCSDLLADPNMR